jgi:hypothetical protein
MRKHDDRKSRSRPVVLLLAVIAIAILSNVAVSFAIPYIVGQVLPSAAAPPSLLPGSSSSSPGGGGRRGETSSPLADAATRRRRDLLLAHRGDRDDDDDDDEDAFCDSLGGGAARGAGMDRVMVHALVSNAGHFPFLRNVVLSMARSGLEWRPVVFAMGSNVCPMIENSTELGGRVVCVPYLGRLLRQMARDEPESVVQIRRENKVADHGDDTAKIFDAIDSTFYGWGGVEHKFLINAKLYVLRDVLACGYDAFVTDTDVGFRRDPRGRMHVPGPRGDVVAQNDTNPGSYPLDINSGFMYWRCTASNAALADDMIKVPPFWHIDQARVNSLLHERGTPHALLDVWEFPNGHMFLAHRDELDDGEVVAFHANYNDGRDEKEDMLRKMGLWYPVK